MPRTLRDSKLDTRAARERLKPRREPYWRSIADGLAIGYRKGAKGGTWIARHYTSEQGRRYEALGTADDAVVADGAHVLSFAQAQGEAQKWFARLAREDRSEIEPGPYSVRTAMADYIADYKRRGGRAAAQLEAAVNAHILPDLGDVVVAKLTRRRIETWHAKLAEQAPRVRTKAGKRQRHRDLDASEDGARRRRSTANRVLTILKAALNLAHHNRLVDSAEAWSAAKPFREVDAPKIRYLSDDETRRLVNACQGEFRALVSAALLTGARYSELAAAKVSDYSAGSASLYIARSKSGKSRHVHLSEEGVAFFDAATAGKEAAALLFPRGDGEPWGKAHQFRPIGEACKAAKIVPAIGFHVLRHSYASRLAVNGVPMAVIAAQLGHSDTRMTERHYAHLAPSYIATTVRAAFGAFGIIEPSNVEKLERKG